MNKILPTHNNNNKSLPMSFTARRKEIPFCIWQRNPNKGSMTVEAAVVLPLFAGFLLCILFFFRVLQVETAVASALSYAARATAVEASLTQKAIPASAELLFRKEIAKNPVVKDFVAGKGQGISMLGSSARDDYVTLCATYKVSLPINFFGVSGFWQNQKAVSRKWTGKTVLEEGDDPYVYYTETGRVYHLTRSCPYLDLSIHQVALSEVDGLRNKSGGRYSSCNKCMKNGQGVSLVYITDYGDLYHASLSCSRLKRTVYQVRLSQVGSRPPCKKCGGK